MHKFQDKWVKPTSLYYNFKYVPIEKIQPISSKYVFVIYKSSLLRNFIESSLIFCIIGQSHLMTKKKET